MWFRGIHKIFLIITRVKNELLQNSRTYRGEVWIWYETVVWYPMQWKNFLTSQALEQKKDFANLVH